MMRTRHVIAFVAAAFAFHLGVAQVGTWRNYTSMKRVKSIARSGNTYWAATEGGLFNWREGSSQYERFTNTEGLQKIDLTAVAVDTKGNVWAGASTGHIHVYDPSTGSWRYVLDIAGANQTNKRINNFVIQGDTVLICTDFGLSVFINSRFQFGDTYTQFAVGAQNVRFTVYSAAIFLGHIYAAISDGQSVNAIAYADLSNPNLLPPEAWSLESIASSTNTPRSLKIFNGQLYAGTASGVYYLNAGVWMQVPGTAGRSIVSIDASATSLVVCTTGNEVLTVDVNNQVQPYGGQLPYVPTSVTLNESESPIVGTVEGGILTFDNQWIKHFPNGPNSNAFSNIVVAPDGKVWGASGYLNGQGFYRYDGSNWKSFNTSNSPLPVNEYYRVSVGCDGTVWASSWGGGVVEMPAGVDSVVPELVYRRNVGLVGFPDTGYVVVSNTVCDDNGNTWLTVFGALNKRVLATKRQGETTWKTFPLLIVRNQFDTSQVVFLTDNVVDQTLAVDAFDNLWSVVREGSYKGVVSLGNRGTIDSVAKFHLTSDDGLPSDDIKTIVVDKDNDIWIGTDKGIAIVLDPLNPTRTGGIASYKPLDGLVINTIAVDPLNQKWVGTNEGAILLSRDGTQQLESYTVENTGGNLIDNDVKSIAIDPKTGTVYFGTINGLASVTTTAVAPLGAFAELKLSPNPFILPGRSSLTIDGLVEDSQLKILTIDGRLVRELTTPGGRIGFWDGRDEDGDFVSSGIYIVVAYSDNGKKIATGKLAVLRR